MRLLLIIVSALFTSLCGYSQNKYLSIMYVHYDSSMDRNAVRDGISKCISELGNMADSVHFAIFFANTGEILDEVKFTEAKLGEIVSNMSPWVSCTSSDELVKLSELLNKEMKFEFHSDEFGHHRTIKSLSGYNSLSFDLFVGKDFLSEDKLNSVIARLIYSNSLEKNSDLGIEVKCYQCGETPIEKRECKFGGYFIINSPEIIKAHE